MNPVVCSVPSDAAGRDKLSVASMASKFIVLQAGPTPAYVARRFDHRPEP